MRRDPFVPLMFAIPTGGGLLLAVGVEGRAVGRQRDRVRQQKVLRVPARDD
jgi:hypothetical protein